MNGESSVEIFGNSSALVEHDRPDYIRVTEEFLSYFSYEGATGYRAFLAWAMDTGQYMQGDLAVWHMADIRRLVQCDAHDREVLFVIQNTEYAIIITKNIRNLLIEVFRIRIDAIEKELHADHDATEPR